MTKKLLSMGIFILYLACGRKEVIDPTNEPNIEIETLPVTIISANELTFQGTIRHLNTEEVLDKGFILYDLSTQPAPPIEISAGKNVTDGETFKQSYKSTQKFQIGKPFGYTCYIRTKKAYYKGAVVPFIVDLIKVETQGKQFVTIGETFVVKGNFEQIDETYYLTLGTLSTQHLEYKRNDEHTELSISIPSKDLEHGQVLELILHKKLPNGNNHYQRKLMDIEMLAKIDIPQSNELYYNDGLPISGLGLPTKHYEKLKILINGKSHYFHTGLRLSDFGPFAGTSIKWAIDYGPEVVEFPQPISLKIPNGGDIRFNQSIIHPFEYITVTGLNYKTYYDTNIDMVKIGKHTADIVTVQERQLTVTIDNIPNSNYPISIYSPMYTIESQQQIRVEPLVITDISAREAYPFEEIILKGSFIKEHSYAVSYPIYTETWYQPTVTNEMRIQIPYTTEGDYNVQIGYANATGNNYYSGTSFPLKIRKPIVEEITPLTIKAGEILTIKGRGLKGYRYVFFNDYTVFPHSVNNDIIQVRIPYTLYPGKYKIILSTEHLLRELKPNITLEVL